MNMYGDSCKDNLHDDMVAFLKKHPISELLEIVASAVSQSEEKE